MSIYVLKGLVYRLSHDWHFDIDRDVSTAHRRSSSGDIVDLLSRTICTTLVVSDWCITNHGWWVSIQSTDGIVRGGNWSIRGPLWRRPAVICCLTIGIHTSGISIPPSLLMLLGLSLNVNSLSNSTRVPVRVLVNKLNFVTEGIMHSLICVQCVQK